MSYCIRQSSLYTVSSITSTIVSQLGYEETFHTMYLLYFNNWKGSFKKKTIKHMEISMCLLTFLNFSPYKTQNFWKMTLLDPTHPPPQHRESSICLTVFRCDSNPSSGAIQSVSESAFLKINNLLKTY